MSGLLYTDGDVIAGAQAMDTIRGGGWHDYTEYVRSVLDAVAPAIAARALREAHQAHLETFGPMASQWLRARADEIEQRA